MKTILVVVVLLLAGIAGIAGLGFYQGWFRLSSDSSEQQPNATFTVDKDKIHADGKAAKDTAQGLGQDVKEEADDLTEKAQQ